MNRSFKLPMIPSTATRMAASGDQLFQISSRIEADNAVQAISICISCLSLSLESIRSANSRNTLSNMRYAVGDLTSIGSCLATLMSSDPSINDELSTSFLGLINMVLSNSLLSIHDTTQLKLILRLLCRTISDALLSSSKLPNQPPRKELQDALCTSLYSLCSSSRQDSSAWKFYRQYLEGITQFILSNETLLTSFEKDLLVRMSRIILTNLISI